MAKRKVVKATPETQLTDIFEGPEGAQKLEDMIQADRVTLRLMYGATRNPADFTIDQVRADESWKYLLMDSSDGKTRDHTDAFEIENVRMPDLKDVLILVNGIADAEDWFAIFILKNGMYFSIWGGSDYSGWGCQEGGGAHISDNLEEAYMFGLAQLHRDTMATGGTYQQDGEAHNIEVSK